MGKEFFMGWELWEQLSFCLACGLAITIIAGLIRLQYTRAKVRKYGAVENGKRQEATPEMLEGQPISEQLTNDDIPFGIRALERGIEVEGVYISRSNTPATSTRSSVTDVMLPRSHNGSQLELPRTLLGGSSRNSSNSNFGPTYERAVSSERMTNDSRSSSPVRDNVNQRRGPPTAHGARYSNNPYDHRNSITMQALEGLDPASSSSAQYETLNPQTSSSNSGKSRSSDESDYMSNPGRPYEPAYLNPKDAAKAVPHDPRTDLHLLQSHRLSHVAETGQLLPRVRRPGQSGEWASVAEGTRTPQDISTANGVDYFMPRQKTPSPPPLNPVTEAPRSAVSQGKQPMPPQETYVPEPKTLPATYQPRGPQNTYEDEPEQLEVTTAQNSQHQSQVLRKVNSGFEILKPGTLGEPISPEDDKPAETMEKRKSKRLQKRRTSSSASRTSQPRTSHFVEQV